MKNLLRSTLYLSVFALAGILFQISCSNSDKQSSSVNSTPIGKIVFFHVENSNRGIWTCDYDGSNETQIPISLPSNITYSMENGDPRPKLSPDGQKVFFNVQISPNGGASIYSCNIDGTNLQPVIIANNSSEYVGGVY